MDKSDCAKKVDLANLKYGVDSLDNLPRGVTSLKRKLDGLDIGKLETIPVDLSQLSNVVKTDSVKMTESDE